MRNFMLPKKAILEFIEIYKRSYYFQRIRFQKLDEIFENLAPA